MLSPPHGSTTATAGITYRLSRSPLAELTERPGMMECAMM